MCRYTPPTPTFSSDRGPSATVVRGSELKYTATFDSAVTGVVVADFGLASTTAGVVTTKSVSTADNINWVLTVIVTGGVAETDLSVTMPANSGSIENKNTAGTNNGFFLTCTLCGWMLVTPTSRAPTHAHNLPSATPQSSRRR